MAVATKLRLGDHVEYLDHDGNPLAAMVTATPETLGSIRTPDIPRLQEGEIHLVAFSAGGAIEPRHNVREGREARCWRPMTD